LSISASGGASPSAGGAVTEKLLDPLHLFVQVREGSIQLTKLPEILEHGLLEGFGVGAIEGLLVLVPAVELLGPVVLLGEQIAVGQIGLDPDRVGIEALRLEGMLHRPFRMPVEELGEGQAAQNAGQLSFFCLEVAVLFLSILDQVLHGATEVP